MASDKARSLEPCWVGVRAGIAVEIAPVHPGVTGLEEDEESESGYNRKSVSVLPFMGELRNAHISGESTGIGA